LVDWFDWVDPKASGGLSILLEALKQRVKKISNINLKKKKQANKYIFVFHKIVNK